MLANTYGAIPFTHGVVYSTDANAADLQIGQVPYYTMIDWCNSVLLDVANRLPARYSSAQKYGRATSVMALAIRARMRLYAASPLVNGNTDYAGNTNKAGVEIFSQTYDPTRWQNSH